MFQIDVSFFYVFLLQIEIKMKTDSNIITLITVPFDNNY